MKKLTLLILFLLAAILNEVPTFGVPYVSDDFGFPVKPTATVHNNFQQSRSCRSSFRAARRMRTDCQSSRSVAPILPARTRSVAVMLCDS